MSFLGSVCALFLFSNSKMVLPRVKRMKIWFSGGVSSMCMGNFDIEQGNVI